MRMKRSCQKNNPGQSLNTIQFIPDAKSELLIVCHVLRRIFSREKLGSARKLVSPFLAKITRKLERNFWQDVTQFICFQSVMTRLSNGGKFDGFR